MMKESECCLAHAVVPVVLRRSEAARLWSAAAPRDPPLPPVPLKQPVRTLMPNVQLQESITDTASISESSEKKEEQRRQQQKRMALKEAKAAELRSRETIKQLESALVAAQVLQERDAQMQLREIEKRRLRNLDATFAAQARKRDEEDLECDKERVRMRQSQKLELRHHLDNQLKEIEELKRKHVLELQMEKQENEELQGKIEEERRNAEKKVKTSRRDLLAQDLQMIKEVERRRRENSLADEKESTKCNLYSEFRYKMQNKLKHLHEQQVKAEKSRIVPNMIKEGQKNREVKLDNWMFKTGIDRKDRESKMLADAETRLGDRKKRAIELGEHQREAAEERMRRDKDAEAKEKAFDWRRQQKLTREWKKLQQEDRRRQQVSNREAYHHQILEERADVEWEAAVDKAEEFERRRRHKREDAQVLSHAQAALEQCKISGKPVRPLLRAIHNFKQRRGMLPNGPQRASVLSHLQVGLDPQRVAEQPHHYLDEK